jgi:RNA-directed DNA polymerase
VLFAMLYAWAKRRHPGKGKGWALRKYWRVKGGWYFQPPSSTSRLRRHVDKHYQCYVKVAGNRSPYDGDWVYWSTRLGYHPDVPPRVARLLKRQKGRCLVCGMWFRDGAVLVVRQLISFARGGSNWSHNQLLLHRHCQALMTARRTDRM